VFGLNLRQEIFTFSDTFYYHGCSANFVDIKNQRLDPVVRGMTPWYKLKQLAESLNEDERSYLLGLLSAGN